MKPNQIINILFLLSLFSIFSSQSYESFPFDFSVFNSPYNLINNNNDSCSGKCFTYNFDNPSNINQITPIGNITPSFGSPSFGPGYIMMWSLESWSEGVSFTNYQFKKGGEYCLDYVYHYSTQYNLLYSYNTANLNAILTKTTVLGTLTPNYAAIIPTIPAGSQQVSFKNLNGANLINPPSAYREIVNFTSNDDYQNILFYPFTNVKPMVYYTLRKVIICEKNISISPCDFKVDVKINLKCQSASFIPIVTYPNGSSVAVNGYSWDFGDGQTSNDSQNINHIYSSTGVYYGTLIVNVILPNGECCTKKVKFTVQVREQCSLCDIITQNTIKYSLNGAFRTFSPTIPHDNSFLYSWELSDNPGSLYNTRDVLKSISINITWVKLTIISVINDKCCLSKTSSKYDF